jgi:hypothetical protein
MRTDDLIVALARSAGPVRRLPSPSIRLAQWTAATVALMLVAVVIIGPRANVTTAVSQPAFLLTAIATIFTALLSAASAFVLSIPGAERSAWQRALPLLTFSVWSMSLAYLLASEGEALRRLQQWPFHAACLIEIAGLSVLPGLALFAMLRRAAPLQLGWSGAFAALASAAVAAAATQFMCGVDDPAHQLVGHVLPVVVLSMLGALAGQRYLNWMSPRG